MKQDFGWTNMDYAETVAYVKEKLDSSETHDYSLLAFMLKDFDEVETANQQEFARLLAYDDYGCSEGDVRALLEYIEKAHLEIYAEKWKQHLILKRMTAR